MNEVFVDRFADPAPVAYEVMTGPIAAVTWQNFLLAAAGPGGVMAQHAIHDLLGAECRYLDVYSYGVVDIDAATGSATITLKDSAGNVILDQATSASCVKTIGG